MSTPRPLDRRTPVVVSYSSSTPRHSEDFARKLGELADVASVAARAAGLDVTWVNAADPGAVTPDLMSRAAGVIVLGGADVDPSGYGRQPAGTRMDQVDPAADEFEMGLIRAAIADGLPLFAICRGAQLLNVALGGSLVQDLGVGMHRDPGVSMVTHAVDVHPGTRLADILGAGAHLIRSGHHQAIERIADGLAVTATAPDGVVEAVELPGDAWVVGVQWHPEDSAADPAPLGALLASFASAAARRRPALR